MNNSFFFKPFALLMFFTLIGSLCAQSQQPVWNGTTASDWTGTGTENDPYLITTAEQLAGLAAAVNAGNDFEGEYIKLNNDLYMSDPNAAHEDKPQWTPIGGPTVITGDGAWDYRFDTTYFRGTFDGAEHTIYHLYYNTLPDMSGWDDPFGSGAIDFNGWYKALFGWLDRGTIKNLTLANDTIVGATGIAGLLLMNNGTVSNCHVSGFVVNGGDGTAGGLVGENLEDGIIENCSSNAHVKAPRGAGILATTNRGIIRNCHTDGKAHCSEYTVGGLVASNMETGYIVNSSAAGEVSRSDYSYAVEDCGGFVGNNDGIIKECTSSADVVSDRYGAGFCGSNYGRIESCIATGDVTIHMFGCSAATFVGTNGRAPGDIYDPASEGICINCFATGSCTSTDSGTLYGFLSNFNDRNNRKTITAYCTTDASNYPYNDLGVNAGGTAPGIKGGGLRRSTAVMQSQAFVDTLNMMAAVAGTSAWRYQAGDYPVPTGEMAPISTCFSRGGSGTKEDPFRISSKEELLRFSQLVNLGWTFEGQYLLLEEDITLNAPFKDWSTTAPTLWIPIGRRVTESTNAGRLTFEYEFRGTFDGGFHSVNNMYLNTVIDETPQGFFGIINGATIKNLSVNDAWIKAEGAPGILVGISTRYCMPTHILQCHTSGTVEGSWSAGGILGSISIDGSTNVINSSSSATLIPAESAHPISGDQNYIGGPSYSNDTVANFFFTGNTGDYAFGYSKDIVHNCYFNNEMSKGDDYYGRTTTYMQSKEFANELNWYVAQYNERYPDEPLRYWQVNENGYPSLSTTTPPHTVTYNTNGGNYYTPQPVLDDSYILPPPIPQKEGLVFYGWFADEALTQPFIFDTTAITEDRILYAKWQTELIPDFTPFNSNPFATVYTIYTPEQLLAFAQVIDGVEEVIDPMDFEGKTVKLGADIMFNDTANWKHFGNNFYGRIRNVIGGNWLNNVLFRGTFDGDGHTIFGLYMHPTGADATNERFGFFGTIAPEATVKNVTIKASRFVIEPKYGCVGLLAGLNRGIVDNCHVEGEIEAVCSTMGLLLGITGNDANSIGRVANCSSKGVVMNTNATWEVSLGGLVGYSIILNDSIVNCSSKASVINKGAWDTKFAGGLIGSLEGGAVQGCYAAPDSLFAGHTVGGLIGMIDYGGFGSVSGITDCRVEGDIIVNVTENLGGIVGRIEGVSYVKENMKNCHYEGNLVSTGKYIGGLVGYMRDSIIGCSFHGSVTGGDFVGGLAGYNNTAIINSTAEGSVSGINNVGGLAGYSYNAVSSHSSCVVSGNNYVGGLIGDSRGITDCYATGNVTGNRIVGGLSGRTMGDTKRSHASGNVTGGSIVGGLSGYANLVDSCYAESDVIATGDSVGGMIGQLSLGYTTAQNNRASGKVSGRNYVGGFAGVAYINGTFKQAMASGDVDGNDYVGGFIGNIERGDIEQSYATGNVSGKNYVGGFSGNGGGRDCFARGNVTGEDYVGGYAGRLYNTATRCFSTGFVSGTGEHVSGFAPKYSQSQSAPKNSYYDSETSGQSDSESGIPFLTNYMKNKWTYEDWDFETIWGRKDTINDGYPYLRWTYAEHIEDETDQVLPTLVTSISLNMQQTSIYIGRTAQLNATLQPDDATDKTVNWSSDNISVASVDAAGLVTGIGKGTATITATTADGRLSASCLFTVDSLHVTGISINPTSLEMVIEETHTLTVAIQPTYATDKRVSWTSNDPTIATVDESGNVTGVSLGTTTIIATTIDGNYSASCTVTVKEISVTGVSIDNISDNIYVGQSVQLTATVYPANAANKNVTWSLDGGEGYLTLTPEGLLTGISAGTVSRCTFTVTTEDGGYIDSQRFTRFYVNVRPGAVTGVTLDLAAWIGMVGETLQLHATVQPDDAENKALIWETDNQSVATVDANGLVTTVGEGTVHITVRTVDGNYTATCELTVMPSEEEDVLPASVTLSESMLTLSEGQSTQLTATVLPENATDKTVTWTSNATAVATVDADGTVTAIGIGTAIVTATTTNGRSAFCMVTVEERPDENIPATSVTLSQSMLTLTEGQSTQLTATVLPENATDKTVTWTSNATTVATVDSDGTVTAIGVGTAIVTATTTNGFSAFCMVTVNERPNENIPVTGVTLDVENLTLSEGETAQLTATVLPDNATNQALTWQSNNNAVATVDADGIVTAVAIGNAVISVHTVDGNFTAQCTINVEEETCTDINYTESFASSLGEFTAINLTGTNDWYYYANYQCAYINGYNSGDNNDWLVSPVFDLQGMESATLSFTHANGYGEAATWNKQCKVLVSANYTGDVNTATWHELSGIRFSSQNWEWVDNTIDIPMESFANQSIVIAFHYNVSSSDAIPAWEVKNFNLQATCSTQESATQVAMKSSLSIYPNPVFDYVRIESEYEITQIRITDSAGHLIMSFTSYYSELDLSRLPAGIYFMQIETTNGLEVRKIVKK